MAKQLKIMSFNLRVANPVDGINYFFNRVDRVLEVLETENPDIVGFQEVEDSMRAYLREHLHGYTIQGCGRGKDCHGEAMVVAYRKDVVELIRLETFWLSMTPKIPGSRFENVGQSRWPRMFVSLLLKHNDVEKPFRVIDTHLDHKSDTARYLGGVQLAQYISTLPEKFILTGDFNANPDTPGMEVLTGALAARGGRDCTAALPATFHEFGTLPPEERTKIDYIFSDFPCVESYLVEDTPVEGRYYSDHHAVCAILEME